MAAVVTMKQLLEAGVHAISRLAGISDFAFAGSADAVDAHPVGKVVTRGAELFVPLAGLIDLDEERSRLER
ncbi:MAG: hypothetical protein KY450_02850, partial [Actinobacteria bacterium]|nr:hypothetical protein [Actinomycetota bacterium]